jgi:hypothetical protein
MRIGGGGTRPADAGQATASCSGGHPPATAVSAADTNRPDTNRPDTDLLDTDLLDTDRGFGSSSGQPRRPRCPAAQPAVAGLRRTRSRRCGATARPRTLVARLRWSSGQVDAASGTAVRMRGHRTRPAEHREPARPALRTPATAAGHGDTAAAATLDSRSRTVHHPAAMSDRNGTPMCGTGQHARLTARSVVWGRPESQRRPVKAAQLRKAGR